MKIRAVIWDYDGTLADSREKNRRVIIQVLKNFDEDIEDHLPGIIRSAEAFEEADKRYRNWRHMYMEGLGLSESDTDKAGSMWNEYQLKSSAKTEMLQDCRALKEYFSEFKMGICSQNSKENIIRTLKGYGIENLFQSVIGVSEIPGSSQKPDPAGFVKCVEELKAKGVKKPAAGSAPEDEGCYVYIGDHREDVVFAKNAEKALGTKAFAITFAKGEEEKKDVAGWEVKPDYVCGSTAEILSTLEEIKRKR